MCAVSNIGDSWTRDFPFRYPNYITPPSPSPIFPNANPGYGILSWPTDYVSRADFEQLKNEVAALKELLLAAKKFDEATGQPDCEVDEKVAMIKKIAKMVGIDMKDVFPDD